MPVCVCVQSAMSRCEFNKWNASFSGFHSTLPHTIAVSPMR